MSVATELAEILQNVQNRLHYQFSFDDVWNILSYTVRKAEQNGKGRAYVPLLFEDELSDFVMRKRFNERGAVSECAGFVEVLPA